MIIRTVREVIGGRKLNSVAPEATVRQACMTLAEADDGALAVMADERLVGILGEHDVIRKCIAGGRRTDETRVADIMSPNPVTVRGDAKLADAMELMVTGGFRHLPVTDGNKVIGVLSMRDIPTEYRLMYERFAEYQQSQPSPAMA